MCTENRSKVLLSPTTMFESFHLVNLGEDKLFFPANEVWGKVMFLHLCVILWRGGFPSMHHRSHDQGGLPPGGVCLHGGLHPGLLPPRGVCTGGLHPGGSASRRSASKGRGLPPGGSASRRRGFASSVFCRGSPWTLPDTVNKRAVLTLLECILVTTEIAKLGEFLDEISETFEGPVRPKYCDIYGRSPAPKHQIFEI